MPRDTSNRPDEFEPPPPGYRLQADDTSYGVERMLIGRWRVMSPVEKAATLAASFRTVERLSTAGVRLRHPDANEREVWLRVAALRLGRELMVAVYGWDPDAHGA